MKNTLIFLIGLFFIVFYSISLFPFGNFFENSLPFISGFRILFGGLLFIRLFRSLKALPLLFSYSSFQQPSLGFPEGIFYIKIFLCICLIVGIYSDIAALLMFLLHVVIFLKSRYYSIEDIYFQNSLFHLPFLASGTFFSLDSVFNNDPLLASPVFFNSFFISNGLIMYSAGYEKLKSKMWLSGKGACLFVELPHLVRKQFHVFQKKINGLFIPAGYLIVAAEFFLLASALDKYTLMFALSVLIVFSILLFIIVDISFIGQILLLNYLLFGAVVMNNWEDYSPVYSDFKIHWNVEVGLVLIVNLFILVVAVFYPFAKKMRLDFLQKFLTGVNSPISVFNEKHLFGFYTYRLFYKNGMQFEPVLETFDQNGFPGPYQILHPRYFQGAMYPVTDYCLGIHKYGPDYSSYKQSQMADLLYCGLRTLGKKEGEVILAVKKYDFGDTIGTYSEQKWVNVLECRFEGTHCYFKRLNMPPLLKKSFREV
jgi:hypothetical protein